MFAVALALRAVSLPTVLTENGILPGGMADEFYHLRRIWYSVVNFPEVLYVDPYVNFPDGGSIHWPPGFDWLIALMAWLLVGSGDQAAVEQVAAWTPPILGALTVVFAARVGATAFGWTGGVVAGVGLALLPAHWEHSRLGAVDHHVAAAFAGIVLLGAAIDWLRAVPGRGIEARGLVLGLALGLPLLIWPGFLIHVAVTEVVLVGSAIGSQTREMALGRGKSLALAHVVAAGAVVPFGLGPTIDQFGAWSPLVLSRFQPAWLGGVALVLASAVLLWKRWESAARSKGRIVSLGGMALVAAGIVLVGVDELEGSLAYAVGWFASSEEFQRQVAELRRLEWTHAVARFSYAIVLFPLAWVGVTLVAVQRRAPDAGLVVVWAALFFVMALLQNRFTNSLSVPYVLLWGGAVAWILAAWPRVRGKPGVVIPVAAGFVVATGAAAPVARYYDAQLRRNLAVLERPELAFRTLPRKGKQMQFAAARWLERSTPPTQGYLDASLRPEYGVLSGWAAGHLLRYVAERPMVQDNFGVYGGRENFDRAWSYYAATDEKKAVALLERLRVRYVVADRFGAGVSALDAYAPETMGFRLARLFGSRGLVGEHGSEERVVIPALVHHRLVFHARSAPGRPHDVAMPELAIAVFERVAGARVEGRATPGSLVEVRLRLATQGGIRHVYRAEDLFVYRAVGRADAGGRYALTLPYPTSNEFSDAVRVVGRYRLSSGGEIAFLGVSESEVREGRTVSGPVLVPQQVSADAEGREEGG